MDRSNIDPFWNHVFKMDDGSMNCEFCERPFPKGTSISRIKWHLSGEKGHGVAICGHVPKDVQEAAFLAMRGGNRRQKTIASSSNVKDNAISSCPQEENNEVQNLAGDAGRMQMAVQGSTEQEVGEGRTSSRGEAENLMENMAGEMMHNDTNIIPEELIVDAHETRGGASQAPDIMGQAIGRSWDEIRNLLMEDDIENVTRGDPLPTSSTKIVGQAFEKNKNEIWSWLMDDEVSSVGIYGMAGVGKTRTLQHIYNQLLERPDISRHVYWVTVSRDFSIYRFQNLIAKCIDLELSNEDEQRRAVKLSKELKKKHKWILILDDLWNHFELHKVGIPITLKGCKLIVTTRSDKVCQRMGSQKKIKVQPLSKDEAWILFMEVLGHDIPLSPEVNKIAQSITEECDGLPLGITTMAGAMKGVDDIHEWRNAWEDLKQSRVRQDDMEDEVFQILRFSYMHLKDSTLQQCFLYCALYPEDFRIYKEDLIIHLMGEGVIKRMKSREAEIDKGYSMLNTLVNVCLLECSGEYVTMHDLIRDMALQIQQENSEVMVRAGVQLKELPDEWEWTENLVRVSLIQNQIQEIPLNCSPRCPNLSTLLLCENELRFIADSFFKQLHGLKVLNLSRTKIRILPDSISDLVSLNTLLLYNCPRLRHVPSLKKLRTLERLDIAYTALEKMPQGMECLSNLRDLVLNGCGEKEFPCGILPKLTNLQRLELQDYMSIRDAAVTVEGKEVACLRKLEILNCHFEGYSDFEEYLKSRDETQSLSACRILVGKLDGKDCGRMAHGCYSNKIVGLGDFSINGDGDFQVMFSDEIEELVICKCNYAIRSLCDVSSIIQHATKLEVIRIWECYSMESLVSSSWFCSAPPPSPPNGIFSGLKELYCSRCTSMKQLFPPVLLPNLVNLEVIEVDNCHEMEDLIERRDEEGAMDEEFSLPKLKFLTLIDLSELKSICSGKLICDSLEEIGVWGCDKLKRMSVSLPLLDNGMPSPPPSLRRIDILSGEWWETVVEWEHPNAKDVLRPFCTFHL